MAAGELPHPRYQELVVGSPARYQQAASGFRNLGKLLGAMLVIRPKKVLQGKAAAVQEREHPGFHPFPAQGLGRRSGIIIQGIEPV